MTVDCWMEIVGFFCHKYTIRKWNTPDKERVEGRQLKFEQTEYCITMLHPTSASVNTEVLFPDCPSHNGPQKSNTTIHRKLKFHNNQSLVQMNNSDCFALMYRWEVYLFSPKTKQQLKHNQTLCVRKQWKKQRGHIFINNSSDITMLKSSIFEIGLR